MQRRGSGTWCPRTTRGSSVALARRQPRADLIAACGCLRAVIKTTEPNSSWQWWAAQQGVVATGVLGVRGRAGLGPGEPPLSEGAFGLETSRGRFQPTFLWRRNLHMKNFEFKGEMAAAPSPALPPSPVPAAGQSTHACTTAPSRHR